MRQIGLHLKYEVVHYRELTTCDLDDCGQPIVEVYALYANNRLIGEFGYVCARKVIGNLKKNKRRLEERFS